MIARCERCDDPAAEVERRVEYRSLRDQRRLRTWRVELLCRQCTARDADEHDRAGLRGRHPGLFANEPAADQGALW
ncbi:MAG: hypothetical protein ACRD0B_00210 [Acidimicrobiales bacterium]